MNEDTRKASVPCTASDNKQQVQIAPPLLDWYDRHARNLPWRAPPGTPPTEPYRVWLSEIMLQQTTVVAVAPYFERFLARWPRIEDLAAASLDDVLTVWAGLGYYARARNLHRCAEVVTKEFNGIFPDQEMALLKLPGIGPYTAAAISAIAFDRPAAVVDGNVERVISRLFALETPLPAVKPKIKRLAEMLTPQQRPGDYAQAMMDLGATICLPRNAKCMLCPLSESCQAHALGRPSDFPYKTAKPERPTRYAVAYFMTRDDGAILLRRRPEKGLLGGMMEIPSSPWRDNPWDDVEAAQAAPLDANWMPLEGDVRHTFTHFHFEITVWAASIRCQDDSAGRWVLPDYLGDEALPSVMRKIIKKGLQAGS